jgi:membrane protease YdiL (CAAX protease family)
LTTSLPPLTTLAFALLTVSLVTLWVPRAMPAPWAKWVWTAPFAGAFAAGLASGLMDAVGALAVLGFAAACAAARCVDGPFGRVIAHAVMLVSCAGLLLHIVPGFRNPLVLDEVSLAPDALPYSKYLNFDKGIAGLFLLGVYASDRVARDEGLRRLPGLLWRFVMLAAVAIVLALAVGYVRWDPKLPTWWPLWLWSMFTLTALPEEALFRGVLQTELERRWTPSRHGVWAAIVAAGVIFGVAHGAGGPVYVALSIVAGIGYGWIYASTRSILAAIVAHGGLNLVHFLFFTYPALAASGR